MAVSDRKQTNFAPILVGGLNLSDLTKNIGWVQNINHYQNAWETRDGFGIVGIHDTQMLTKAVIENGAANAGSKEIGFNQICGTYAFTTDFGHEQILIITKTLGNNAVLTHNFPDFAERREIYLAPDQTYYTIIIYDATTEEFLEEPLYRKTTSNQSIMEIADYPINPTPIDVLGSQITNGNQHGAMESSWVPYKDYADLVQTTSKTATSNLFKEKSYKIPNFFFQQVEDKVYFGSTETGIYYYIPCIFSEERSKRVENYIYKTISKGYSETSVIKKLIFNKSITETTLAQGYNYVRNNEVPTIVDFCIWNDRVVYLTTDKTILYSQPNEPYAIIDVDFDSISSDNPVTGIAEVNGRLMVFSKNETFVIQPIDGTILAAGGRILKASSTIGCVSSTAKVRQVGILWFMDQNGAYTSDGSGNIKSMTEPAIDKFFKIFIENAFTHYYTNNGLVSTSNVEMPLLDYSFNPVGLQTVWDDVNKHIVFNFTELFMSLIFAVDTGEWYIWNYQSVAVKHNNNYVVGASNKLNKLWLSATQERLFGSFTDLQSITDGTRVFNNAVTNPDGVLISNTYRSYPLYVTEYGRGGSLDRSNILDEDKRKISSGYVEVKNSLINDTFYVTETECNTMVYFEKGYWVESPFYTPNGNPYISMNANLSDAIYWVPISVQLANLESSGYSNFDAPNNIYLQFSFDKTNWTPVFNDSVNPTIEYDLPTERLGTDFTVSCFDPTTYSYNQTGSSIVVICSDEVNITQYNKNPLILLPFRKIISGSFGEVNSFSLGITETAEHGGPTALQGFKVSSDVGRPYSFEANVYEWMETYTSPNLKNTEWNKYGGANIEAAQDSNKNVQAVDWLYKGPEVGDGKSGLKPRGTSAQLTSRGSATDEQVDWYLGLYNILVSTNNKQYQGQILDYSGSITYASGSTILSQSNTPANNITMNKDTNVFSIQSVSSDSVVKKTFGNPDVKLSSISHPEDGNYLVDSEIFVNKVTSDGTRGERFSYTVFGHIKNYAEKLKVKSIDAMFRVIGEIRRTGR